MFPSCLQLGVDVNGQHSVVLGAANVDGSPSVGSDGDGLARAGGTALGAGDDVAVGAGLSSWRTDANKSPMVGAPDTVNICMHGVSGGKLGSCWGGLVHTSCLQDAKLKFKTRKPIKKQVTDATDGRQYKLH